MKTMRQLLLPVLLFAFGFFVVHDYVIADVDADTQFELCCVQGDNGSLDLPSQIHEHIHVLFSAPDAPSALTGQTPLNGHDRGAFDTPSSHITSVQPRPPLV
jgi:hypothetical protein